MNPYKKKSSKSLKWLIGSGLILLTIFVLSFYIMQDYSVYFYTPGELVAKASGLQEKEIRVGGMVKPGSVVWSPKKLDVSFVLSDLKGVELAAYYKGTPPDMFKEGSGVVVEGFVSQDGKKLTARNLFVKHSEEYRVPEDSHKVDPKLIQKSIIKNEKL